jgi:UDP-N-acetylglucosamine acyltransferase
VIGDGVKIGAGTWIGPHAVIKGPTTLGEGNKDLPVRVDRRRAAGSQVQGRTHALEIGDRNVFREFTTMNRGTGTGGGVTTIGSDNSSWLTRTSRTTAASATSASWLTTRRSPGTCELGDWVIMGGYAGTHQFTKVGAHAFLGNNARSRATCRRT